MNSVSTTPPFVWKIRVYYEDTDAGGIVFYANYLKFFERARTEWLRAFGVGQQEIVTSFGAMFVVSSTEVNYHAPARLDDELELTVVVERAGKVTVEFLQEAWRVRGNERTLLSTGRIKIACVNTTSLRPTPIPKPIMDNIREFT